MSPLLVLLVAVLATTYAGPIVRFATAPALAIAFWRLALVLPVTGVLAAQEGTAGSAGAQHAAPLRRGTPMLMTLAGLLLALHFWSWIASLRYTAVASSVVLVSLKSVFAWAIAALWLREHPTRTEAWGIGLAVVGASLIGVGDARFSRGALGGDGLALLGAVTGAGYYVIGRRVRQTVGVWRYATGVYALAAAALALLAVPAAVPLAGFAGRDWAAGRACRRRRSRRLRALGGEAVPGVAPGGRRRGGPFRFRGRGAGAGVRVPLERAGSGGARARAARQDRMRGARFVVRAAPAA